MCAFNASQHCFWQRYATKESLAKIFETLPFLACRQLSCRNSSTPSNLYFSLHWSMDHLEKLKCVQYHPRYHFRGPKIRVARIQKKSSSIANWASQSCHECLFVNFEDQMNNANLDANTGSINPSPKWSHWSCFREARESNVVMQMRGKGRRIINEHVREVQTGGHDLAAEKKKGWCHCSG